MNENNINAFIGKDVEYLFKESIKNEKEAIEKIKNYFKLSGNFEASMLTGIYGEKSDVKLGFSCGHAIDANIKAFQSGFNQLTRASVDRFCDLFKISDIYRHQLKELVIAKSKNPNLSLFPRNQLEYWEKLFSPLAFDMIKWGLSYKSNREILVLFNRCNNEMRIYPMKEILRKLNKDIKFTKGGFNIGSCISFQRKGGNGSLSKKVPKYDIKHPGNNLQLKIQIKSFIKDRNMENILLATYITKML